MLAIVRRYRPARLCAAAFIIAGALCAVTASPPAGASTEVTLYASPTGIATSTCAITNPCSLGGAQSVVESLTPTMTGDIVVELRGGVYQLASPWTFSSAANDSGTNGYRVIYTNYPGETPEISGSQRVTGWTLHNSSLNIWSANVGVGFETRELYVNGVRAEIARGPSNPSGWTPTSTGLTGPNSSMASWPDVVGAEVVSENTWVHKSCPITAASGTSITLAQPCYTDAELPYDFTTGGVVDQEPFNVSWVQNAYELLTSPGMFYLNSGTGTLYYIPRAGEDLATADVEAPVLQTLVTGSGTDSSPLANITFSGLTFEYATWLAPSLSTGYAEGQAGWHITGTGLSSVPMNDLTPTPGEVEFDHDIGLSFNGDTFTHMGSVGLELNAGSQDDTIIGSRFTDIGSNAIQIGAVDPADTDPASADQVVNNTVQDNVITLAGQVYRSAVGIFIGYTTGTVVTHNVLGQLPYTAISVNLGWEGTTYSGDATITDNEIYQDMTVLNDGGALYTQMAMASPSIMEGNYLHDEDYTGGAPLYLDSNSSNWTVEDNVLQTGSAASRNIQNCCSVPAVDNTVEYNYSNGSGTLHGTPDPSNTVENNYDNLSSFPPAAQTIMANAGLEPAYQYLLTERTVNDNSSTITYSGPGWNYSANRGLGDYDDDLHYSYSAGATVSFPFTGSGVSWLAQRSNETGPVEVYIDGVDEGTITPTESSTPYPTQQVDYGISGLAAGGHTITIVNNDANLLTVDAFTVEMPMQTVNDTSSSITYTGPGWNYSADRGYGDYDNDLHYSYSAGATVSFPFTGSGVSWLAQRSNETGPVEVYIDGVDEGTITPTESSTPYPTQQVDYSITGLAPGNHTLTIVNNTANLITVDAFTVEPSRPIVNDTDSSIIYSGPGWGYSPDRGYGDYDNDLHYSYSEGATVTFPFDGSGVSWLAQRSNETGPVEVYIDGVDEGTITPTESSTPYPTQQVDYSITGLAAGYHTITIVNNAANLLTVDAFTVLQ